MIKILIQFTVRLMIFLLIVLISPFIKIIYILKFEFVEIYNLQEIKNYLFTKKIDSEITFIPIKNLFYH